MLSLLLLSSLAASPHSLAMPGVNSVGMAAGSATLLTEIFAQEMTKRGLKLLASRDIEAVLGLERHRQLLNCAEERSCLAELAGALGVEGIVVGDLGKVGTDFAVNLKVINAADGATLALFNARTGSETQLPDVLTRAAGELSDQLAARGWVVVGHEKVPLRLWAIIPAVVGIAGVAVGVPLQVQAQTQWANLRAAPTLEAAVSARDTGKSQELIGNVALGVGLAGLVTAVVLLVIPEPRTVNATAWVSPTGSGVGLTGVFP